MVFAASPRRVELAVAREIAAALPPLVSLVGVFVNPSDDEVRRVCDAMPNLLVQLSGTESPAFTSFFGVSAIKAIHIAPEGEDGPVLSERINAYPDATILFDTENDRRAGGTGQVFAWDCVVPFARHRRSIVGGGLTPQNVAACVRTLRPFGVDVRSGVERDERKDGEKMRAFVEAVREADADRAQ